MLRAQKPQIIDILNTLELASEGYLLALGDLASNQTQLGQVASECTIIQKGLDIPGFTPQVYHCSCDVAVESQVGSLVQAAVTTLGGIDVVGSSAHYNRISSGQCLYADGSKRRNLQGRPST